MSENHKKIWITGASSGIGKAVAEKFAKEGWQVAISARTRDKLDKIAHHPNIFSFPLDVTIKKDCARVFQDIIDKSKHHIISSVHPSPLSANKGFFGSNPFSKSNKFLVSKGLKPIDWKLN